MIARIWRGAVRRIDKDNYLAYLKRTGLKEYAATPGHRGVWILCRVADDKAEFTLISLWDSWEAIRIFAGPEPDKAVFYPEDEKFLVEKELVVHHYEVLGQPSA